MERKWWHNSVVYQIYPRSFQDSNGDGIGDLQGIIQRLDYLEKLGVDVVWLSPVYQSPNDDNGYDISDYYQIMPEFGTMQDMEELIAKAKQRGIKIVMDLVVNHTSDEHQWFIEAKKSKDNPYRDYYIWRDPVDGHAPNDLTASFGGSAWEFDETTQQYYLHFFSKKQPDLNWENPKLRQAIYAMMNFWIDKGIAGFRMDVIDMIGKKPDQKIIVNGPQLHEYLKEMHQQTFGPKDLLTVGEAWSANEEVALLYGEPKNHELNMVFQLFFSQLDQYPDKDKWFTKELNIPGIKELFNRWQLALNDKAWNALVWENHDLPRCVSRFGDPTTYRIESAKMLAIVLYLLKGLPYIYQGQEIGMTNTVFKSIAEVDDIESKHMYHDYPLQGKMTAKQALVAINQKGRDNARTPMQWDNSVNGGFSQAKPWLAVNQNYPVINVEASLADEDSIFYTYQKLIALRKQKPVVVYGDYQMLPTDPNVYAYIRSYQGQSLLVVANLSKSMQEISLPQYGYQSVLLSNYAQGVVDLSAKKLKPYEAFVIEIK